MQYLMLIWVYVKKGVYWLKRVNNLWITVKPTVKQLVAKVKLWATKGREQKKPDEPV